MRESAERSAASERALRLNLQEIGMLLDELFRVQRLGLDAAQIMPRLVEWRRRQRAAQENRRLLDAGVPLPIVLETLELGRVAPVEEVVAKIRHLTALARDAAAVSHLCESQQAALDTGITLARELGAAATPSVQQALVFRLVEWADSLRGEQPSKR